MRTNLVQKSWSRLNVKVLLISDRVGRRGGSQQLHAAQAAAESVCLRSFYFDAPFAVLLYAHGAALTALEYRDFQLRVYMANYLYVHVPTDICI